jgi:hypothetical protein
MAIKHFGFTGCFGAHRSTGKFESFSIPRRGKVEAQIGSLVIIAALLLPPLFLWSICVFRVSEYQNTPVVSFRVLL